MKFEEIQKELAYYQSRIRDIYDVAWDQAKLELGIQWIDGYFGDKKFKEIQDTRLRALEIADEKLKDIQVKVIWETTPKGKNVE